MADVSDSFNFYDLYGYLFPGFAMASIFVFPFWCDNQLPLANLGLASTLVGTVGVYIGGHLLQTIAVRALPSASAWENGRSRYPSDLIVDEADKTFTGPVKKAIAAEVLVVFDINLNPASGASANRNDAFFLCRDSLVAAKQAAYVEQFQGMYSLMRGLCLAFLLGLSYLVGWALAPAFREYSVLLDNIIVVVGVMVALGSSMRNHLKSKESTPRADLNWSRCLVAGLMIALAGIGRSLGIAVRIDIEQAFAFAVAAGILSLLFFLCYGAYKFFAKEYAKSVWRGFLALRKISIKSP